MGIDFFYCLTNAAPNVIGLHLEPFGFQSHPDLGPVTKFHAERFEIGQWNVNFYEILNKASEEGILEIDYIETELFFPSDANNPTSVAIWHKK